MTPIVKLAATTTATTVLSVGGWGSQLVAEVQGGGSTLETAIPAAALTATSGALVWVVRQIVSGKLVHRDPEYARLELAAALKAAADSAARAAEREDHYRHWILGIGRHQIGDDHRGG